MNRSRAGVAVAFCLALGIGTGTASVLAAQRSLPWGLLEKLLSEETRERRAAAKELLAGHDASLVAPLVDAYFFTPRGNRAEIQGLLEELTGESFDSYQAWVEYLGSRTDLAPPEEYVLWKVALLAKIDRRYHQILHRSVKSALRLEELIWGGVRVDGIPSLDDPPTIPAEEARYLDAEERVFGVAIGDKARAYPLRFLDWHEMVNDSLAGQPYALSYCTLCGSGILYATDQPGGRYWLGTSGLLYRSNKLMFDRESYTLWSNITGEPVVGRLVGEAPPLRALPMTLTTWGEWSRRHPQTDVLDLAALRAGPGQRYRFDYSPGAADRARAGVSFPVWQKSDLLPRDAEVYALRVDGRPKAWWIDALVEQPVLNDRVGATRIVLVTDPASAAVRAYRSGDRVFESADEAGRMTDERGIRWTPAEAALVSDNDERLDRLPGHVAYWFGWYGFYPRTEVYTGPADQ